MKKTGNILVILFLLIATGGIPITRHYCGNSIISVSLISTPKPCCGSDCERCRNENSFYKVTDDFTVTTGEAHSPVVWSNLAHGNFIYGLYSSLPPSPLVAILTPRKFLYQKTGDIPAIFGNFRC